MQSCYSAERDVLKRGRNCCAGLSSKIAVSTPRAVPLLAFHNSSHFHASDFHPQDCYGSNLLSRRLRISDHDVHLQRVLLALQVDLLLQLEPHFAVDNDVDIMGTLEVAGLALLVRLYFGSVRMQRSRYSLLTS